MWGWWVGGIGCISDQIQGQNWASYQMQGQYHSTSPVVCQMFHTVCPVSRSQTSSLRTTDYLLLAIFFCCDRTTKQCASKHVLFFWGTLAIADRCALCSRGWRLGKVGTVSHFGSCGPLAYKNATVWLSCWIHVLLAACCPQSWAQLCLVLGWRWDEVSSYNSVIRKLILCACIMVEMSSRKSHNSFLDQRSQKVVLWFHSAEIVLLQCENSVFSQPCAEMYGIQPLLILSLLISQVHLPITTINTYLQKQIHDDCWFFLHFAWLWKEMGKIAFGSSLRGSPMSAQFQQSECVVYLDHCKGQSMDRFPACFIFTKQVEMDDEALCAQHRWE